MINAWEAKKRAENSEAVSYLKTFIEKEILKEVEKGDYNYCLNVSDVKDEVLDIIINWLTELKYKCVRNKEITENVSRDVLRISWY